MDNQIDTVSEKFDGMVLQQVNQIDNVTSFESAVEPNNTTVEASLPSANNVQKQSPKKIIATKSADDEEYESAFFINTPLFEGPIEMLLQLVKKTKVPIMEVRLADITDAYLEEMRKSGVLDLDNASEFISVATILIDIKAKSLLPDVVEIFTPDIPLYSAEMQLKLQMQRYELFKEASEKLKSHEEVNMFFKKPEPTATRERIVLADMNIDALLNAFAKMLNRLEINQKVEPERAITKDRFTVAEKMQAITECVRLRQTVDFDDLYDEDYSKVEKITTFQAMLELLKIQVIRVRQDEIFGRIEITYRGERERQDLTIL